MTWQPIETAPKDGTVILLYSPEKWDSDGMWIGWWFDEGDSREHGWYDSESASHKASFLNGEPTHWHPLPEPPA